MSLLARKCTVNCNLGQLRIAGGLGALFYVQMDRSWWRLDQLMQIYRGAMAEIAVLT